MYGHHDSRLRSLASSANQILGFQDLQYFNVIVGIGMWRNGGSDAVPGVLKFKVKFQLGTANVKFKVPVIF